MYSNEFTDHKIRSTIHRKLQSVSDRGRTAKLWIECGGMVQSGLFKDHRVFRVNSHLNYAIISTEIMCEKVIK